MGQRPVGQGGLGLTGVVRLFDRALAAVACALLTALLLTVLAGVVTRAAGAPLIWTDEGARFLMVWLAAFGWMIAGRRRAHVRIRYFQGLLPAAWFGAAERVIQAALILFGLAIAWFGQVLIRRNLELEATSLPISMAWLYIPLVPAGLTMAVQAAVQFIEGRAVAGAVRVE
jgi:TRAP-type C4-dicarboxylate transport system permease small subunit